MPFGRGARAVGRFFGFFLVSGFCGLVYEVVWLRLAMAQFGVTTPLTSIVLSTFMAGLALGSWAGGKLALRIARRGAESALRAYAAAELVIAVSGVVVPIALGLGGRVVGGGAGFAWGSSGHTLVSAGWIVLTLLPFCTAMGTTFPLAMAAIRGRAGRREERSFSYLYLANVLGALAGTLTSAFVLIELLGFRKTSLIASALNAALATAAFALSRRRVAGTRARAAGGVAGQAAPGAGPPGPASPFGRRALWLLFGTGLVSLGMEVVWIRQFTPYLGTVVYSFAAILTLYLAGTFVGSQAYRRWAERRPAPGREHTIVVACSAIVVAGLLPLATADARLWSQAHGATWGVLRVALGVTPFCAVAGFLTPMLVDRCSGGDAGRAGIAYGMNVVGCIVGPLLAGFVLLPWLGEARALFSLAVLPLVGGAISATRGETRAAPGKSRGRGSWALLATAAALAVLALSFSRTYESQFPDGVVKRDHTATVVARGQGLDKRLLVNGYGMTTLTPISKVMAHLPLAFLASPPERGLVICFGMGTSFRSMASWGIRTTGVELVPSVPELFGYYHEDGPKILQSPRVHVVIDDGRRFMEWSAEQFDVITIDPPPPVEAAGSSLLYSREFYRTARKRLRPGGILQQWFPGGEAAIESSVVQAIRGAFPYVRTFPSVGGWGFHMLASATPIADAPASVLAERLPARASADLVEWFPEVRPEELFQLLLDHETPPDSIVARAPRTPEIRDDRPINEYFFLRRWLARLRAAK